MSIRAYAKGMYILIDSILYAESCVIVHVNIVMKYSLMCHCVAET